LRLDAIIFTAALVLSQFLQRALLIQALDVINSLQVGTSLEFVLGTLTLLSFAANRMRATPM
jgi:hypothetical protein